MAGLCLAMGNGDERSDGADCAVRSDLRRPAPAEVHEDRRARGIWLKQNKKDLGRICRAVIAVEADPVTRMAMQAQALAAGKAFGLAMVIASSASEAEEKARVLLYGEDR